jgi:hypothetical protein
MKVKCINNDDYSYYLTIGKIYDVIYFNSIGYKIFNDVDYSGLYPKKLFKSLSEIRNEKIDKLLE